MEPTHHFSLLCAGRSALKLNLTQTASQYLTLLMQQVGENQSAITPIKKSIEAGEIKLFNQWYIQWLTQNNNDPFQLALAYGELGETEKAIDSLSVAIKQRHVMVPTVWAFAELNNV
ncbi:MAG: hypothetical protein OQK04_03960, partial [Kangiellaceae bacterium]|nr:hypothetical protein [Kangiellaceae bacterium]